MFEALQTPLSEMTILTLLLAIAELIGIIIGCGILIGIIWIIIGVIKDS